MSGVIPVLSVPNIESTNDWILSEALAVAAQKGLVGPEDHVVCLQAIREQLMLKIVSTDTLNSVSDKKGESNLHASRLNSVAARF